jgi:centromere protein S
LNCKISPEPGEMEVFEATRSKFRMPWSVTAQTGLARVIEEQLKCAAKDVEAFCKHARRSTINADDVRLLARRNPSLLAKLQ